MPEHKKTCRLDRSDDGDNRFIAHDSAMHRGRFDYGSMLNGFSFAKGLTAEHTDFNVDIWLVVIIDSQ